MTKYWTMHLVSTRVDDKYAQLGGLTAVYLAADVDALLLQRERETWEAILQDLDALGLLHEQVTMSDEVKVFVRRCRTKAQEVGHE